MITEAAPWKTSSGRYSRGGEPSQKKKAWMRLSGGQERRWRWEIRLSRSQLWGDFATQELLKDLSGDHWADTATPPLTSSPRKNLELPLTSETSNMGLILLSTEESKKNTFEGNKNMFLETLDEKAWREFLSEFNQEIKSEITLDDFKEELWDTVVKFGEPVLMGTGLDEKARKELLSKMVKLRETRPKTREDECKNSSSLKQRTGDKIVEGVRGIRLKLVI